MDKLPLILLGLVVVMALLSQHGEFVRSDDDSIDEERE